MLNSLLNNFKKRNNSTHDENQYLNTIEYIIDNGKLITGRNGNVYTIIGCPMHFSLENDILIKAVLFLFMTSGKVHRI